MASSPTLRPITIAFVDDRYIDILALEFTSLSVSKYNKTAIRCGLLHRQVIVLNSLSHKQKTWSEISVPYLVLRLPA